MAKVNQVLEQQLFLKSLGKERADQLLADVDEIGLLHRKSKLLEPAIKAGKQDLAVTCVGIKKVIASKVAVAFSKTPVYAPIAPKELRSLMQARGCADAFDACVSVQITPLETFLGKSDIDFLRGLPIDTTDRVVFTQAAPESGQVDVAAHIMAQLHRQVECPVCHQMMEFSKAALPALKCGCGLSVAVGLSPSVRR